MTTWKKPAIYCVSAIGCFLAGIAIIFACGPEPDPYDYDSFFHIDVPAKTDSDMPYLTTSQFLDNYTTADDNEEDINAAEWAAYLGKNVKATDVETVMYNQSPKVDSLLNIGYLNQKGPVPDSLASNTFLKALVVNKSALKYYRFAKSVEKLATIVGDDWDVAKDTVALRTRGAEAFTLATQEKDKFIQLRYYYQSQRLLHYAASYQQANTVYDKYIAPINTTSHVKGWAMALKAGEARWLKDTVQAAYLFSKIFVQYPERRLQAYKNYQYINIDPKHVMPQATTDAEKANIYAISGFGESKLDIEPLKHVYALTPASPIVGALLIREINKLERGYVTYKLNKVRYHNENWDDSLDVAKQIMHAQQLKDFCKQLAADRKYPEPEIATLGAAYIAWMRDNTDEGSAQLKLLYNVKLRPALDDQRQVLQLLLSAQAIKTYNRINEGALLPALQWLDKKVKAEAHESTITVDENHPFAATQRNFYEDVLAPLYLKQSDTTIAALALAKVSESTPAFWNVNMHSDNLRTIFRWKSATSTNDYVTFLLNGPGVPKQPVLLEMLGTAYLREHQYTRAAAAFKRVDTATLSRGVEAADQLADPFIERINDYPRVYTYGKAKGYNKLQFAQAMAALQQKIKTDPDNQASYYYKLATGIYNTSTYGNAWYLISYSWTGWDFCRAPKNYYDADYIKTINAEEYFMLARKYGKTAEFKAKCTFMAAKCRQKQASNPDLSDNTPNFNAMREMFNQQLRGSTYFAELKNTYKRTDFYKKAVGECSYLKDFIVEK